MSPPRTESSSGGFRRRGAVRWLLSAALLALIPKCVLCVMAYIGAGTALVLVGPEWCREVERGPGVSWMGALVWLGVVGGLSGFGILATRGRSVHRSAAGKASE